MSEKAKGPKYKGTRFVAPAGRASYPAIFKPVKKYQSEDEEYKVEVLYPASVDLRPFKAKCDEALAEVFGADKTKWPMKQIVYPFTPQSNLIEKAQEKNQDYAHYDPKGFMVRFKTNAGNGAPPVVDQDRQPIIESSKIYGGCWVRVACQIKIHKIAQVDPVTKKKAADVIYVTTYLQAVQLDRDDDSFGNRPNVEDLFEPIAFDNGGDSLVDPLG